MSLLHHPDGYTPPRRVIRPLWPRMLWMFVVCALAAAAWCVVALIGILIGRVISMFR